MQFDKLDDNPKLINVISKIHSEPWPRFLNESAIIKKYWRKLYKIFPQYQFLLKDNSEYIGLANTFPIYWNGENGNLPTGFDESIETILQEPEVANTLCALAIVIKKKFSGKGLSTLILKYVKEAYKILKELEPELNKENFLKSIDHELLKNHKL